MSLDNPPELTAIADAIVAVLNANDFSQPFTAKRGYLTRYDVRQLQTLRVSVVPVKLTRTRSGRGSIERVYEIDIGIEKKVTPENLDETDALVLLAEELADFLELRQLEGAPQAKQNDSIEIGVPYERSDLQSLRVFTCPLNLKYKVLR